MCAVSAKSRMLHMHECVPRAVKSCCLLGRSFALPVDAEARLYGLGGVTFVWASVLDEAEVAVLGFSSTGSAWVTFACVFGASAMRIMRGSSGAKWNHSAGAGQSKL